MTALQTGLPKKIVSFTFWGVLTTVLNVGLFALFRLCRIPVSISTILAWFFCVLFAFITNKRYVFKAGESCARDCLKEIVLFYGSRVLSGLMDVGIMLLLTGVLHWNEVFSKVTDEIIVSGFNFAFSFLIIFRRR